MKMIAKVFFLDGDSCPFAVATHNAKLYSFWITSQRMNWVGRKAAIEDEYFKPSDLFHDGFWVVNSWPEDFPEELKEDVLSEINKDKTPWYGDYLDLKTNITYKEYPTK